MKKASMAGAAVLAILAACGTVREQDSSSTSAMPVVASPADTPKDDNLIVPGKRMGLIYIGMPVADLYKLRGDPVKPPSGFGYVYGDGTRSVVYDYGDVSVNVTESKRRVVDVIWARSSRYRTAEDIGVGSSQLAVQAKLPPVKIDLTYLDTGMRSYCYRGMEISIEKGNVTDIRIPGYFCASRQGVR